MNRGRVAKCGVVVIGRNEGKRLERCLLSVIGSVTHVVYVDSGSTDDSIEIARRLGAEIVNLDMSIPFTAARARNEGFERLLSLSPMLEYVQFVDGDCELLDGWILQAQAFLDSHGEAAAVCGRLRERFPERSVYNLLCDLEWDTPIGEAKACGGIALMRVCAFKAQGGFRQMIAGEEPELCVRLRQAGWKIWRIDAEMGWHDADMTRFSQWWKRAVRGGYAFAEGAALHGMPPEMHWVKESRRAWLWGLFFPLAIIMFSAVLDPLVLLVFAIYPIQVCRLAMKGGKSSYVNWARATFLVVGKFPEVIGQIKYVVSSTSSRHATLIEYK